MGENEQFTDEELAILGEKAPTADPEKPLVEGVLPEGGEKPLEPKQPEHTDEEKTAIEQTGAKVEVDPKGKTWIIDDEGTRIPLKRWRENYRESMDNKRGREETEKKFNQFRELGPEKYYAIYPNEKPADWKPPEKPQAPQKDIFDLVAQYSDPNHPYNGKTLREIYATDPAEARRLERAYEQDQTRRSEEERGKVEAEKQRHQHVLNQCDAEINDFTGHLSKEMFGKDASTLSKEEKAHIDSSIQATIDWMQKSQRGAGILADAYFLMNKEKIIADAKAKGGKGIIQSLSKPSIPSINAGSGAAAGGTEFENMTREQLAAHIANLDDAGYEKFMKSATPEMKAKLPDLPWS